MDPQIITIAKLVLGWSANIGAGRIVSSFASSVPRQNVIDKVCVPVGGFALASVTGAIAQKHMTQQIDQAVEMVEKMQEAQKKNNVTAVK